LDRKRDAGHALSVQEVPLIIKNYLYDVLVLSPRSIPIVMRSCAPFVFTVTF
jgi:hypothetical protein